MRGSATAQVPQTTMPAAGASLKGTGTPAALAAALSSTKDGTGDLSIDIDEPSIPFFPHEFSWSV